MLAKCSYCPSLEEVDDLYNGRVTCSGCEASFNPLHDEWLAKHPDQYQGTFASSEGKNLSIEEQAKDFLEGGIVKRFGAFVVTTWGLENLEQKYPLLDVQLNEPDWVRHMSGKNWVNVADFEEALNYAKMYFKQK